VDSDELGASRAVSPTVHQRILIVSNAAAHDSPPRGWIAKKPYRAIARAHSNKVLGDNFTELRGGADGEIC
jgi:hypothetical protein